MPIQLRAQVAPTYSMPRFESGNVNAPTIAFDASQSTGLSYADGIALSHNGAQVLHVGNTVTVDAVLVGNGGGGGAGAGGQAHTTDGYDASNNSGSGGGGGGGNNTADTYAGGKGGSGVIIVRYLP